MALRVPATDCQGSCSSLTRRRFGPTLGEHCDLAGITIQIVTNGFVGVFRWCATSTGAIVESANLGVRATRTRTVGGGIQSQGVTTRAYTAPRSHQRRPESDALAKCSSQRSRSAELERPSGVG